MREEYICKTFFLSVHYQLPSNLPKETNYIHTHKYYSLQSKASDTPLIFFFYHQASYSVIKYYSHTLVT